MPKYLLLARDAGEWSRRTGELSPQEVHAIVGRYLAWNERLAREGNLLSGDKLKDGEGRVLAGQRGSVQVTDGPYTASKEVVGGLRILEAATYEDAIELANDSPHLEFGSLELREIEQL